MGAGGSGRPRRRAPPQRPGPRGPDAARQGVPGPQGPAGDGGRTSSDARPFLGRQGPPGPERARAGDSSGGRHGAPRRTDGPPPLRAPFGTRRRIRPRPHAPAWPHGQARDGDIPARPLARAGRQAPVSRMRPSRPPNGKGHVSPRPAQGRPPGLPGARASTSLGWREEADGRGPTGILAKAFGPARMPPACVGSFQKTSGGQPGPALWRVGATDYPESLGTWPSPRTEFHGCPRGRTAIPNRRNWRGAEGAKHPGREVAKRPRTSVESALAQTRPRGLRRPQLTETVPTMPRSAWPGTSHHMSNSPATAVQTNEVLEPPGMVAEPSRVWLPWSPM